MEHLPDVACIEGSWSPPFWQQPLSSVQRFAQAQDGHATLPVQVNSSSLRAIVREVQTQLQGESADGFRPRPQRLVQHALTIQARPDRLWCTIAKRIAA
eukprot:9135878-Pyramimonas_sp.AAC.1